MQCKQKRLKIFDNNIENESTKSEAKLPIKQKENE